MGISTVIKKVRIKNEIENMWYPVFFLSKRTPNITAMRGNPSKKYSMYCKVILPANVFMYVMMPIGTQIAASSNPNDMGMNPFCSNLYFIFLSPFSIQLFSHNLFHSVNEPSSKLQLRIGKFHISMTCNRVIEVA